MGSAEEEHECDEEFQTYTKGAGTRVRQQVKNAVRTLMTEYLNSIPDQSDDEPPGVEESEDEKRDGRASEDSDDDEELSIEERLTRAGVRPLRYHANYLCALPLAE